MTATKMTKTEKAAQEKASAERLSKLNKAGFLRQEARAGNVNPLGAEFVASCWDDEFVDLVCAAAGDPENWVTPTWVGLSVECEAYVLITVRDVVCVFVRAKLVENVNNARRFALCEQVRKVVENELGRRIGLAGDIFGAKGWTRDQGYRCGARFERSLYGERLGECGLDYERWSYGDDSLRAQVMNLKPDARERWTYINTIGLTTRVNTTGIGSERRAEAVTRARLVLEADALLTEVEAAGLLRAVSVPVRVEQVATEPEGVLTYRVMVDGVGRLY